MKHTGGEFNTLYAGIGAKGYDVVSYFTKGAPALGSEDFTHAYGGVSWRFSSKEHRDQFAADPAKYAPQYGGFCAWGVGHANKLFDIDPASGWTIHKGKLYLNFNQQLNEVFRKDADAFIAKGDVNWHDLNR